MQYDEPACIVLKYFFELSDDSSSNIAADKLEVDLPLIEYYIGVLIKAKYLRQTTIGISRGSSSIPSTFCITQDGREYLVKNRNITGQEEIINFENMTAPCGIPCFECNVFKAKTDPELKKIVSERTGIPYEKAECSGCRNHNGKCFLFEKNNIFPDGKCFLFGNEKGQCKIYLCAESKKIHNCSECSDFPCGLLHPLADNAARIPHNIKVFNLCLIKKMGLEKWAKEKAGDILRKYYREKF